jgi:hypothetical protein
VVLLILGGTLITEGSRALFQNLFQMHTRAGAPLVWGVHWRYHLLERLALMLIVFAVTGVHSTLARCRLRGSLTVFGGTLVVFGALTLVFGVTDESFRDATFLGHQARELLTHGLVTAPLALGLCLSLVNPVADQPGDFQRNKRMWLVCMSGISGLALGAYLVAGALLAGAVTKGQSQSLIVLIFPHLFEHSFTYLVTPLVAGLLYLGASRWAP